MAFEAERLRVDLQPQKFALAVVLLVFGFFSGSLLFAADECELWFLRSGVKPGSRNCELDCPVIPTNMGTFDCGIQCPEFCKTYVNPDDVAKLARYVEPRTLTPAERALIAKYPLDALKVYQAKSGATDSTKRIFGGNFRNDESDAYRHFMWSGLIREQISRERAEAFLNAHEADTGESVRESQMDKSNNESGISAAEKFVAQGKTGQKPLEQEAIQALKRGDLKVLAPSGKVPSWKE